MVGGGGWLGHDFKQPTSKQVDDIALRIIMVNQAV
jgi:hypothetical protein